MIGFSDVRGILKKSAAEALVVCALVAVILYFALWMPAWAKQTVRDVRQDEQIESIKAQDGKLDEILRRLPAP